MEFFLYETVLHESIIIAKGLDATVKDRIENDLLCARIASPQEAAQLVKDGMTVAVSGFTPAGYPKVIPAELVKRRYDGEKLQINLISGANVGPEIDGVMSGAGLIKRRAPLQGNQAMSKLINQGIINYIEIPLNKMPKTVRNGILGKIDIAVIEAIAVTKEGYIIPSASVGMSPTFAAEAEALIVELNLAQPIELQGIHDIYLPSLPPSKKPIPLTYANQKIGEPFIRVNPEKIKCIVESSIPDQAAVFAEDDMITRKIAANLLNFLELELASKRLPKLLPFQSGLGNLANSLVRAFKESKFDQLEFYCGVLQEANLELIAQGKVRAASGGAFTPSAKTLQLLRQDQGGMKRVMVLRPTDISNNAEIIDRLGLIALNNAIEVDIYGNANTSHIMGSKVVNGIGGGGAFAQNAFLSIMLLPSTTKGGKISTVVPMVSHTDISEHDIDVIITENGVADLRGKDPLERADCIISDCANQVYQDQLRHYLQKSIKAGGHQPQLLKDAFLWHLQLEKTGTMKASDW